MRRWGRFIIPLFLFWIQGMSPLLAGGSALKSLEREIKAILKEAAPALVSISTKEGLSCQQDVGSGVIIRKGGYILTTKDVAGDGQEVEVTLENGRRYQAKLVGSDAELNLAVLKIDADGLIPAKLGDSTKMKPGSWVIVLGNSFGLAPAVSFGLFNGKRKDGLLQLSAFVFPGNTGGAVLNSDGELIGIVTGTASGLVKTSLFKGINHTSKLEITTSLLPPDLDLPYQGMTLAIPINTAKAAASQLIKEGKVERGWLGVIIQDLTPSLRDHFGVKKGVLVSDVVDDSPAQKAGMKRGDVIVRFHGEKVENSTQLREMVVSTPPGEEISLLLVRDGEEKSVKVTIGKKPKYSRIGKEERLWQNFPFPDLSKLKENLFSEKIRERLDELEKEVEKLKRKLGAD